MFDTLLNPMLIVLWLSGCVFGGVATMLALAYLPFTARPFRPSPYRGFAGRNRGNRMGLVLSALSISAAFWLSLAAR